MTYGLLLLGNQVEQVSKLQKIAIRLIIGSEYLELRSGARPKIGLPRRRLTFTESCIIYKLIKLINCAHTNNPEIFYKIHEKTHTYFGFNFNVTRIYLSTYTYECTMPNCFKCGIV